jgi:hypothetical protein
MFNVLLHENLNFAVKFQQLDSSRAMGNFLQGLLYEHQHTPMAKLTSLFSLACFHFKETLAFP